jgi:lipopolysaccharide transport system ATP-binding protein
MSGTMISIENLSKAYRIGEFGTGTFYGDLKRWWAGQRGKPDPYLKIGEADHGKREGKIIWALKDINFTVQQGEAIGIIGSNGAGKSTLLKILSQVTAPTSGVVRVKGRLASLLEVGTGFHPELTGRENIFLNGAIMGMTRTEVNRKFDEILDFSGVEQFVDTPVKRYSSGMYVRLAFAVAAHLDPDILVLDEVLAVGDAEFQRKCLEKMADVANSGRTILFVSHNMSSVLHLCKRCVWIDHGVLKLEGLTQDVISNYYGKAKVDTSGVKVWEAGISNHGVNEFKILSVSVINTRNEITTNLTNRQPFTVEVNYRVHELLSNCRVGILLSTQDGTFILDSNDNDFDYSLDSRQPGDYVARCEIPGNLLNSGNYYLSINAGIPYVKSLAWIENIMLLRLEDFEIDKDRSVDKRNGFINPDKFKWEWSKLEHD